MEETTRHGGPGLRLRKLSFDYGTGRGRPERRALCGLDLEVLRGQSVALLGPNGSGKSTLIKLVCGLLAPDAGEVEVFGMTGRAAIRLACAVVFQFSGLDSHLTVDENLRDHAALYGIPRREAARRIDERLHALGLEARRGERVKHLSGGLARRADLARALLHRPRLLMLDEPTSGLDPAARAGFLAQVLEPQDEGPEVVLLSTHLVDEAERCDRVVMLHEGGVVADGAPAELRAHAAAPAGTVIRAATAEPPAVDGLEWQRTTDGSSIAALDDADGRLVARAVAALGKAKVTFTVAPSAATGLADVFERLTGNRLNGDAHHEHAA